jgi:hypothetical protein
MLQDELSSEALHRTGIGRPFFFLNQLMNIKLVCRCNKIVEALAGKQHHGVDIRCGSRKHEQIKYCYVMQSLSNKKEKVTWAAGSSTRASAYTCRRSCLATAATGPSGAGAVLSHLAHDKVRPQDTGAAAATAHLGSSAATVVNLGSGAISAAHLGSSAAAAHLISSVIVALRDDGEKRNMGGWGILVRKIGFSRTHRLIHPS